MRDKKASNVWEVVKQNRLPVLVMGFSSVYWFFTKDIWSNATVFTPTVERQDISIIQAIFASPEMIRMVRITLFYSIPILIFTLFLYMIFVRFSDFSLNVGNFKLGLVNLEAKTTQAVNQAEEVSRKAVNQLDYQVDKVKDYSEILLQESLEPSQYMQKFFVYVRELFMQHKANFSFAFYFIEGEMAEGIDILGMVLTDTPKIRMFLADLIDSKRADFCQNLEERYPDVLTMYQQDVIYNIIGSPLCAPSGEIFGAILVYTKENDRDKVFSVLDAGMLNLLCRYFGLGLNRYNGTIQGVSLKDLMAGE